MRQSSVRCRLTSSCTLSVHEHEQCAHGTVGYRPRSSTDGTMANMFARKPDVMIDEMLRIAVGLAGCRILHRQVETLLGDDLKPVVSRRSRKRKKGRGTSKYLLERRCHSAR